MKRNDRPEHNPLGQMDGPSGIDLHPEPGGIVRVSRRAGLVAVCILCVLATLFAYGVYRRHRQTTDVSLGAADESRVTPATTAGEAITRSIPDALIGLVVGDESVDEDVPGTATGTSESRDGEGAPTPNASSSATPALARPPILPTSLPLPPARQPQIQRSEPTAEERRLAEAYARQLQAVAAPTAVPSASRFSSSVTASAPPPRSIDDSGLETLLRTLAPGAGTAESQPAVGSTSDEYAEQNMQARKEAFLADARATGNPAYLPSTRIDPLSRFEIKAGWEIPAVLEQELNSDLPGEMKALVVSNVYDTATGRYLLIPQGSRLVGTYDSNVAYGQSALQVVWHRIIFPDASSIDLGGMIGQDASGTAGFRGEVDNHYGRLFGFTILSSLFSAGFQLSQNRGSSVLQNPSAGEIAAGAVGQEISQLGTEVTRRNLNVQPTVRIPVGYRFNVRVNRDILFAAPYGSRE